MRERLTALPQIGWATVDHNGVHFRLSYCCRRGGAGPALLLLHGLNGAKENFYAAFQSAALAHCDLLAFDFPGVGLSEFDPVSCPDVNTLADLAHLVWNLLIDRPAFVVGASMGGLVALLLFRRHGVSRLQGFINIEGNLASEDCVYSRHASNDTFEHLQRTGYEHVCRALLMSEYPGDHVMSNNSIDSSGGR